MGLSLAAKRKLATRSATEKTPAYTRLRVSSVSSTAHRRSTKPSIDQLPARLSLLSAAPAASPQPKAHGSQSKIDEIQPGQSRRKLTHPRMSALPPCPVAPAASRPGTKRHVQQSRHWQRDIIAKRIIMERAALAISSKPRVKRPGPIIGPVIVVQDRMRPPYIVLRIEVRARRHIADVDRRTVVVPIHLLGRGEVDRPSSDTSAGTPLEPSPRNRRRTRSKRLNDMKRAPVLRIAHGASGSTMHTARRPRPEESSSAQDVPRRPCARPSRASPGPPKRRADPAPAAAERSRPSRSPSPKANGCTPAPRFANVRDHRT